MPIPRRQASSFCCPPSWTSRTTLSLTAPLSKWPTSCLRSKWAPFEIFGQLLDGLPSMQDSRHSSPSIDQPPDYKSIFFGAYSQGPTGWLASSDETVPHGQPPAERSDIHFERDAQPLNGVPCQKTAPWDSTRTPTITRTCRTF